jgi:hypothetical protein
MSTELDELFNGGLENKMDFLNDQTSRAGTEGLYKVDMSKVKDKKRGWRSVVRFLPNLTQDGKLGQSAIEKISHYVNIKNVEDLSGWFDSPKNFGERCPLSDLYYTLQKSKNAILMEKSKLLNYSRKYYSYVLVLEDEQQPELVGKILAFQYGVIIKDKIQAEKNGEITGVPCNVFDLSSGKDFVLVVKEIQTGDITYPDYKMSMFRPESTSLPIYFKEKGVFKNAPLVDGKIDPSAKEKITAFLLDREINLEDFAPKRLTEEQQAKIEEITNFMTGKSSGSFNSGSSFSSKRNEPSVSATSGDFDFDENFEKSTKKQSVEDDEDDFFSDF